MLRIRPEAEDDLAEAYGWYRDNAGTIGDEFLIELDRTFDRIEQNPRLYAIVYKQARRALVHRFPYAVFYYLDGETASVLAVTHQAQDPKRWQARADS